MQQIIGLKDAGLKYCRLQDYIHRTLLRRLDPGLHMEFNVKLIKGGLGKQIINSVGMKMCELYEYNETT